MDIGPKDLEFIFERAKERFLSLGSESFVTSRPLTHREQVCISYLDAVFALLVKGKVLSVEDLPRIPLLVTDSFPAEEDYV